MSQQEDEKGNKKREEGGAQWLVMLGAVAAPGAFGPPAPEAFLCPGFLKLEADPPSFAVSEGEEAAERVGI